MFGDCTRNAAWRKTWISTESYLATETHASPYARFHGWSLDRTLWDLMRNLHLGMAKHAAAGALV
eukprot:6556962-Alexandrium_andersonii.AAC.1